MVTVMDFKRLAAFAVLGMSLSGCAAMGTSVAEDDPETEVANSSMGRAIMEGLGAVPARRTPINYTPRAPLVVPPKTAMSSLQPPEDPNRIQNLADWPVDPEIAEARRLRAAEARDAGRDAGDIISPSELMALRVPPSQRPGPHDSNYDPARPVMPSKLKGFTSTGSEVAGPYDRTGAPQRRALVEPPVEYLTPAPGQPVAPPDPNEDPSKKKGLFSWLSW